MYVFHLHLSSSAGQNSPAGLLVESVVAGGLVYVCVGHRKIVSTVSLIPFIERVMYLRGFLDTCLYGWGGSISACVSIVGDGAKVKHSIAGGALGSCSPAFNHCGKSNLSGRWTCEGKGT